MKINDLKLAQVARWGFYTLFGMLAILGTVAICLGYFQHIITVSSCITMVYTIKKHW